MKISDGDLMGLMKMIIGKYQGQAAKNMLLMLRAEEETSCMPLHPSGATIYG